MSNAGVYSCACRHTARMLVNCPSIMVMARTELLFRIVGSHAAAPLVCRLQNAIKPHAAVLPSIFRKMHAAYFTHVKSKKNQPTNE